MPDSATDQAALPDERTYRLPKSVIPERYEYLLIDQAAVLAYKDSDNWEAAGSLQADLSIELEDMARDLLDRNYQNQPLVVATGSPYDANA